MGTVAWMFVESRDGAAVRAAARAAELGGDAVSVEGCGWSRLTSARLQLEELDDPASRVSRAIGRPVVTVEAHSVTNWVKAVVYDGGNPIRTIMRGDDGWQCAGAAQPWEARLFEVGGMPEPDEVEDQRPQDQRAVRDRVLVDGAFYPVVDGYNLAHALGLEPVLAEPPRRWRSWWPFR